MFIIFIGVFSAQHLPVCVNECACVIYIQYKVFCCRSCGISSILKNVCIAANQRDETLQFSISQVRFIVRMVELPYVSQMNLWMKNLISRSTCGCTNIQNIELMSRSSQAPIPFTHAFYILNSFLFVCSSKCRDILLWMTNLLKFTYISECKQKALQFCYRSTAQQTVLAAKSKDSCNSPFGKIREI